MVVVEMEAMGLMVRVQIQLVNQQLPLTVNNGELTLISNHGELKELIQKQLQAVMIQI
jgi:hypothetical protein